MKELDNYMLTFNNIFKKYGELVALNNISFNIPQNSIFGILGANGSGKSTLMRILSNLIIEYSGEIKYQNQIIKPNSKNLISSFGFLIENPAFYEFLPARKNLQLLSRISNVDDHKINEVLELVNLSNRANDKVQTYSYGMKQRLGLAQTLLHDPEVLILDEPNNGLDPKGIKDMSTTIKELQSIGKTIILSTHILSEVESLCSHFTIFKDGKNINTLSMEDLLKKSNQYTIEVDNEKIAEKILIDSPIISITSIGKNMLSFTSSNQLDISLIQNIFNEEVAVYQFYKNSGLIDLFND